MATLVTAGLRSASPVLLLSSPQAGESHHETLLALPEKERTDEWMCKQMKPEKDCLDRRGPTYTRCKVIGEMQRLCEPSPGVNVYL